MLSLDLNTTLKSLDKIKRKLQFTVDKAAHSGQGANRWNFAISILTSYKTEIARVMGSVNARGGFANFNFKYEGIGAGSGKEYWKSLSPNTLRRRIKALGPHKPFAKDNDMYSEYGYQFKIWKDTGTAQRIVETSDIWAHDGKLYAGINPSRYDVYDGYQKVEFGKGIPQRRLFTIGAHIFIEALRTMLRDENSKLAKDIRTEYVRWIKSYSNWGKR